MNSSRVRATQSADRSDIVVLAIDLNWSSSRAPVFSWSLSVTDLLQASDSLFPMVSNQLVSISLVIQSNYVFACLY